MPALPDFPDFLNALHGLPQTGAGAGICWGIFKLLDKWLDNRAAAQKAVSDAAAAAAARDGDAEAERAKSDAARIKELETQLIPLAQKAAHAEFMEKENARLVEENKVFDHRIRHLETITIFWDQIKGSPKMIRAFADQIEQIQETNKDKEVKNDVGQNG